ncbi:trypsin alpha-3-like [Daphnia pulicaria]|uniref:trypsin alpha-3-like n=1 Tax=Daphnia pulicaria TaxID=35523 RepID=UPI001EE9BB93|nr:trypsin alpha-3-like [Daphnia pulicaria]
MQTNIFVIGLLAVVANSWPSAEAKKRSADDDDTNESLVGTPARRGAFPNVGAILFDGRHICGATLISTNHVLTGADCVSFLHGAEKSNDLAKLRVYLNTVALKTYNPGAIISNVRHIKFHELYDRKTKANNIAVLTLETNVTTLYPLSLPADGTTDDYVGKHGTILRWGAAKSASTTHKILLQAPVSIISNSECSSKYQFKIYDNSLCASAGSQEGITCHDDSNGGPVIVEGRQVGIMSWGKGCMDFNYPGIYMRTTSFMNWIKSNTV